MISGYINLNSETFDIIDDDNLVAVDKQLAKTLSVLNKKGYLVEIASRAKIWKPFSISDIIYNLIEQGLLTINEQTEEKIKKVIDYEDVESTIIMFKEKYQFESLPKGYKIINNDIAYNLKVLKEGPGIEFKTLVELDHENHESIRNLEEWAEQLPENK